MEHLANNLFARLEAVKPQENNNIHSEVHALAQELSTAFNEPKKFGMWLGVIKRLGVNRTRRLLALTKEAEPKNPAAYFLTISKKKLTSYE